MKITRQQIKRLVKEELLKLNEARYTYDQVVEYLKTQARSYHNDKALVASGPLAIKTLLQDDFMDNIGYQMGMEEFESLIDDLSVGRLLEKNLREQDGTRSVELTTPGITRKQVSSLWPQGVTHNGRKVFDIFYSDSANKHIWSALNREGYGDGQEVYLGYAPSADVFVMGFDAFLDEGEDDYGYDDYDDGFGSGGGDLMDGVLLELDENARFMDLLDVVPGGMYPGGLRAVRQHYPDIIDVRLD